MILKVVLVITEEIVEDLQVVLLVAEDVLGILLGGQ